MTMTYSRLAGQLAICLFATGILSIGCDDAVRQRAVPAPGAEVSVPVLSIAIGDDYSHAQTVLQEADAYDWSWSCG